MAEDKKKHTNPPLLSLLQPSIPCNFWTKFSSRMLMWHKTGHVIISNLSILFYSILFYSILFYSILYLHPIDHYNDKGHVKSNVQYACCHTYIIISYELRNRLSIYYTIQLLQSRINLFLKVENSSSDKMSYPLSTICSTFVDQVSYNVWDRYVIGYQYIILLCCYSIE